MTKLSGMFHGLKTPDLQMRRATPFTKLPAAVLESDGWQPVCHGRWLFTDHVTFGESRAVNNILGFLCSNELCHGFKILSLQGNMATAGPYMKGCSPAPALNFLLRKRAGLCLAARIQLLLPWVETSVQPADGLSRLQ